MAQEKINAKQIDVAGDDNTKVATVAYVDANAGATGSPPPLQNIVEDLTPQLGADIDMNTFDIVTSEVGGAISVTSGSTTAASSTGGAINITTGGSSGYDGYGGDLNITLGSATGTPYGYRGGTLNLIAGPVTADVDAGYSRAYGGYVNITSGSATGGAQAGYVNITGGTAAGSATYTSNITGGPVYVTGGQGLHITDGYGGDVDIRGGQGTAGGGGATLTGGTGTTGYGGAVFLAGGLSQGTNYQGGNASLFGGGSTQGTGGDILIRGGTTQGAGYIGGDVMFQPGASTTDATNHGNVLIRRATNSSFASTVLFEDGVSGATHVGLKAPDGATGSFGSPFLNGPVWTLPQDDPAVASGQFLTTDASGIMSFAAAGGGISNIVEDVTPQLGGNLDVNGQTITTSAGSPTTGATLTLPLDPAITLTLNAASSLVDGFLAGQALTINGGDGINATGSGGIVRVQGGNGFTGGDVQITAGEGTTAGDFGGSVQLKPGISADGTAGEVTIAAPTGSTTAPTLEFREAKANGSAGIFLRAPVSLNFDRTWTLPDDDPTAVSGQFLTTDASGILSFATPSDLVGLQNIVEDTTPQLGGDLDCLSRNISRSTAGTLTVIGFANGAGAGSGVTVQGGTGSTTGGIARIEGGAGPSTGGGVTIKGGTGSAGNGGDILIDAGSGSAAGGRIFIRPGPDSTDNSNDGEIIIGGGTGPATQMWFQESSGNGTRYIALKAPDDVGATARVWELPNDDPAVAAGQFLTTDASGVLSFADAVGSPPGISAVVEDLTPQLGANLDMNTFDIVTSEVAGTINVTAGSTAVAAATGGAINLTAGSGTGSPTGTGGAVTITSGNANGVALAGAINITGGTSTDQQAGHININGGASSGHGGGRVYVQAGSGVRDDQNVHISGGNVTGSTGRYGGTAYIAGGFASASGNSGGSVWLTGRNGNGAGTYGGEISITSGNSGDGGDAGRIALRVGRTTNSGGSRIPGSHVQIEGTDTSQPTPDLRFRERLANGSNYVGFKAPDAVTSGFGSPFNVGIVWTIPQDDPAAAAGLFLTTDANGIMSFAAAGGGSPAGLQNIVEDTTPQLGANLDVNGFDIVGTAGATGGAAAVKGGAGTGAGGNLSLNGGTGGTGKGGGVYINSGNSTSGGTGDISLFCYASASDEGGRIDLIAGGGNSASATSGIIVLTSGYNSGGDNGFIELNAVGTVAGSTAAGEIRAYAGNSYYGNIPGADVKITSGWNNINGTTGGGGNIILQVGGGGGGSSPDGVVQIVNGAQTDNSNAAELRMYEHAPTAVPDNYVGLKAPDIVTAGFGSPFNVGITWTLPQDDPAVADGKFLTTDASGVLSFADLGIQYIYDSTLGSPPRGVGSPAVSHTISHNLNQQFVNVTVYEHVGSPVSYEMIIPSTVALDNANSLTITFSSNVLFTAVIMGTTGISPA